MTNLTQLTERDILIRLDGKFDMVEGRVKTLEETVKSLWDWHVATEAKASGRGSVLKALAAAPGLVWAIVGTAVMTYALFH